ncbi:DUF4349 domain-containing protein [Chitinibacteraceae bacterium HSL-7]
MKVLICLMATALLLTACGRKEEQATRSASSTHAPEARKADQMLAYEHQVGLTVDDDEVAPAHQRVSDTCRKRQDCVVLESGIDRGYGMSASLRVRSSPAGIAALLTTVRASGDVRSQSTHAEDLAAPIADTSRQLTMLTDYRTRLEALRDRAGTSVDALIKINEQLAETQGKIEALAGEHAHLTQRVQTELLTIAIDGRGQSSMWRPVRESLESFGQTSARGLSALIATAAFLLPWLLIAVPLIWGWRRWRAKRRRS